MEKASKLTCIALLLIVGSITGLHGQQVRRPRPGPVGSWRLLGVTQANYFIDHDIIMVKGPSDYFRKLKFKVSDAPLHLHRMVVRYDDGGLPENIELRHKIPQGGESRIIDLSGGRRKLKSVEFWYDTRGLGRGKAEVTLFGLK
jgi:hypothetical protein